MSQSPAPDRQLEIYDTTLRDGTQSEGVNVSLADKLAIAKALDEFGVHYIEGGWPGSNPKDEAFFKEVRSLGLTTSQISAFGSTRRARISAEEDPNLRKLVECGADVCCIFGKTWDFHVTEALRIGLPDNLAMISDSVAFLRQATGKPVFYDAEHFFDGYKANPSYALDTLRSAHQAGAQRLILCDTNGGSLTHEVVSAIRAVRQALPDAVLGIHVHNDGGLAVANTLAAIEEGCLQVQGTINGIGERCGNVDLTSVIANCELKMGYRCLPEGRLSGLTSLANLVWERINMRGPKNQPFVGKAAFAHKGGIHVSAIQRNAGTYEHIAPEQVGNERRVLISELSGRSNIQAKLSNRYPKLSDSAVIAAILEEIQDRENCGYTYEAADASFDLVVRRHVGAYQPAFKLHYFRVHGIGTAGDQVDLVESVVKVEVGGVSRLCAAEGNGPVDALSAALGSALSADYAALVGLRLIDYKVRVVDSADGTAARVRVLIDFMFEGRRFGTVGVHENIIEASWLALVDGVDFAVNLVREQSMVVV
ncbi:MAG: citramalate synthase [Planctomycetota bacterium]|nr:MAG: citramalate synthase [Planctomycetota bacterium]